MFIRNFHKYGSELSFYRSFVKRVAGKMQLVFYILVKRQGGNLTEYRSLLINERKGESSCIKYFAERINGHLRLLQSLCPIAILGY